MNHHRLRELLFEPMDRLSQANRHVDLIAACEELRMPPPANVGSKRERVMASFNAVPDGDLALVAERLLELHPPFATTRNAIQDFLWENVSPRIPKRYRRELARLLDPSDLYESIDHFDALLERLWILNDSPFDYLLSGADGSLHGEIKQHVYRNPGDWTTEYLFERLGAYEASDKRFALFIEGLVSPDVRPDEPSQRRLMALMNGPLGDCGIELRETGADGGYPIFTVVAKHTAVTGAPKNLIFASPRRPDIRFRDAINNDIEIASNQDEVLVYDRPINPADGLRWCDLQAWWSESRGISEPEEAKKTLFNRLRESLPHDSPPQQLLFDGFYRGFGKSVPNLPALLPEVWLHWDPKTIQERGIHALLSFRMDFLLLPPRGVRVVVEVDGKQHYAREDGTADPARYAKMVAADRDLKLAGYQVFRFGAAELQGDTAHDRVKRFFETVFKTYGV